jgi:ribonuclease E
MTKRMLIDASHAEETRVVVLDGNRLEDFDVETSTKRQLKGNIYLAKVVRVEPSLQAAFVEYGGNRHGFLAFGEIHPDYYQIPVADRQRLIAMQVAEAREQQEDEEFEAAETGASSEGTGGESAATMSEANEAVEGLGSDHVAGSDRQPSAIAMSLESRPRDERAGEAAVEFLEAEPAEADSDVLTVSEIADVPPPETIGGGDADEGRERRIPPRFLRNYKIQEVIKRRQILLVQVVKEERGTKGAALTTYISLAGRYCVLMPNSPRGGGISRKITSVADRKRLKEAVTEMDIPDGMGLIVRTAGANRPKPEIKRDCEYLLRLWDDIREQTLRSIAPALIYEEANLIKRAIRDVYSRDLDEIIVDGEPGWRAARDFMRMLMPSHVKKVQLWRDNASSVPLLAHYQVDAQLDAMLSPNVQLKSGGYLVINQTEALVAIDVNSGRATRERGIEETALRTNLEAAEEAARQLRLRDLAGLIVIDFIDMESKKHNAMVERRLKEALKSDRARIQVGHISHFGLLEMSRQRLRPSLAETSFVACPHCGGTGHVRSVESSALHVLRAVEEEGAKRRAAEIVVHVASSVALYILNHKRDRLADIEGRYSMKVAFAGDDALIPPQLRIDRLKAQSAEPVVVVTPTSPVSAEPAEPEPVAEEAIGGEETEESGSEEAVRGETADTGDEGERRRRRRRRRRRGGRRDEGVSEVLAEEAVVGAAPREGAEEVPVEVEPVVVPVPDDLAGSAEAEIIRSEAVLSPSVPEAQPEVESEAPPAAPVPRTDEVGLSAPPAVEEVKPKRRTRRASTPAPRRKRAEPAVDVPSLPYTGPTPADPYAGQSLDIFEAIEQAEHEKALRSASNAPVTVEERAPVVSEAPLAVAEETAPISSQTPIEETHPNPEMIEPVSEGEAPAIEPILVEAATLPAERKRGWWRR